MAYDPAQEVIRPWYYSTMLVEDCIRVEFAPGCKTGVYRFSFRENADRKLLFTVPLTFSGNTFTARTFFHGDVPVYVYGRFNTAITAGLVSDTLFYARFPHRKERAVVLQYAVSYVSTAQAKQNFQKEMAGRDMEAVVAAGRCRWHAVAAQIQVEGGTQAERRSFYTALYRCHERMVNITEDSVYYSGYNKKVNQARRPFYVDDATWDTYQALHPLRMILHPQQEEDMLDAYVTMYEQSGWMPTFPRLYGDHPCMNGFHSTIVFLDAWRRVCIGMTTSGCLRPAQKISGSCGMTVFFFFCRKTAPADGSRLILHGMVVRGA
ncbi:alpha-1,2-mannosidase, putative [Chitinophaga eiseniae]|uniref:Alpha-1,2-mannosidase, putative n=1 Tax=Chitinophaga eiseniae TaxID=634771 RepID=A0A1T4R382_9BACT|nr:glycoside hydrolase domain-containing protein [Chitinophaga eiseniae]SKA10522.1 alpha-1,2-mannosidase, putative [Chitinophaga eiseniae]